MIRLTGDSGSNKKNGVIINAFTTETGKIHQIMQSWQE